MAIATDPSSDFAGYAHPERLVSTGWLAEHLGEPGLVVVESDEDVLLYARIRIVEEIAPSFRRFVERILAGAS